MSIQTIQGRQSLAEDIDDGEFLGKLLATHGEPDPSSVTSLRTVARAGSTFRATLMDTDQDVLFFRMETGTGPGGRGLTRATLKQGRPLLSTAPFSFISWAATGLLAEPSMSFRGTSSTNSSAQPPGPMNAAAASAHMRAMEPLTANLIAPDVNARLACAQDPATGSQVL